MRDEGRAVLLCTHNLDEVERVADRVAVLRSRLVADRHAGSTQATPVHVAPAHSCEPADADTFAASVACVRRWTTCAPTATLVVALRGDGSRRRRSCDMLVEAGAGIEAVEREEPSLEDVYLKLLQSRTEPPDEDARAAAARSSPTCGRTWRSSSRR